MGIDIYQLQSLIIRPTLEKLDLWSQAAENLLIGTCLAESNGGEYLKQINGPALGIYQCEPLTHDDIWNNYLIFRPSIVQKMPSYYLEHDPKMMIYDLSYATAIARIYYLRIRKSLPKHTDTIGLSLYWKNFYNTEKGNGDPKKFKKLLDNYLNEKP